MTVQFFIFIFILLLSLTFTIFGKKSHFSNEWKNGQFPEKLKYNENNLMEAYICLSTLILLKNRDDSGEKLRYMYSFLSRKFPNSKKNGLSESLQWSLKHSIIPESVSNWLFKNVGSADERFEVIKFLFYIATIDGQIVNREAEYLENLCNQLGLEKNRLTVLYEQFEKQQESSSNSRTNTNKNKQVNLLENAYLQLQVPVGSSFVVVKQAYRKLVKIYHPDRYASLDKEKQAFAHRQFILIQEAYDLLEKKLN